MYLYLAEICSADQRPFFNSMMSVFVGIGTIVESSLAVFFHWHTVSIVLVVACLVGFVSLVFVPEPPAWLRDQNRIDEAERAERWFGMNCVRENSTVVTAATVAGAVTPSAANEGSNAAGPGRRWSVYAHPTVWKPALIALGFFVCQQCSGLYVLLFYSADVLRDCKVPWDGNAVAVFLFGTRVISSVIYAALHRVKRKILAVASCVGMATSLATIVVYTKLYEAVDQPPFSILIGAFVVFVFSGQIGLLPMPWTLCGEVFPMAVKGTYMCCTYEVQWRIKGGETRANVPDAEF